MTTARPPPERQLSPPASPTRRRSPTPEPPSARVPGTDFDRKRATSFGAQTSRSTVRPLASADFGPRSTLGGSAGGGVAGSGGAGLGPAGLPRKDSSLAVSSQPNSGRASPSLGASSRPVVRHASNPGPAKPVRSGSSQSTLAVSPLKSLDSYNAKNVAAALENGVEGRSVDDVWQTVCIRVLPLFNGEGHRGFVEDLNELVIQHVQRTFSRCQNANRPRASNTAPSVDVATLVTGLLIADLSELINIGCLTLSGKLAPSPPAFPLEDEHFLIRLNEMWSFFWTGVLPHLESIFWVLRCDERLVQRVDVRSLALIGFRDQLIHPQFHRIVHLFHELYESRPPSRQPSSRPGSPTGPSSSQSFTNPTAATPSPSGEPSKSPSNLLSPKPAPSGLIGTLASVQAANARRRQMVAILASLLTGDERQYEMDRLLSHMRAGLGLGLGSRSPAMPLETPGEAVDEPRHNVYVPLHSSSSIIEAPRMNGEGSEDPHRPRAGTLDSLDEEGTTASSTIDVHEGSTTPQPLPVPPQVGKTRRRGFLPKLGRSRSGNSDAASIKTVSVPIPARGGDEDSVMDKEKEKAQRSPKTARWGRGRNGSMKEDSEAGSEVEPARG